MHTLVLGKYRLWNSNLPGAFTRPVAMAVGPPGTILALEYDFDTLISNLVTIRLHQPCDVSLKREGLNDARDLC